MALANANFEQRLLTLQFDDKKRVFVILSTMMVIMREKEG